jgi:diguanylate cyclase (GGDEF)-like protein/PAS domain S-box-containing protein
MRSPGQKLNSANYSFWVTAFIASICLSILGVFGSREWTARAIILRQAEIEVSNLARSLTQHGDDSFALLDASIIGIVYRLEADGLGPEAISKLPEILAARKKELPRLDSLIVLNEHGDWLAASGPLGPNLAYRDYFLHHQQSQDRDAFVGRPVKSSTTGNWIITVSRRLNHPDGSFGGVAIASVGSDYFSKFYEKFEIGTYGSILLVNADGLVMARYPDNETYVGRELSARPFQGAPLQSPGGNYSVKSSLDGRQRMGAYKRSTRFPIVVLAAFDQEEKLAPWRKAAIARMTLVLALTALIAITGFYLIKQMRQRQRLVSALIAKEADFRLLAEGSSDMVTRIGLDERLLYVSPSCVSVVGWNSEQLTGTPALAGVRAEDLASVNETVAALKRGEIAEARIAYRTRHRNKEEVWIESTMRVTRKLGTGTIDGVVAISRDVTIQKSAEEKLSILAAVDGLTDLANRRQFDERLKDEWARARREGASLSLLLIDVDNFKKFNDLYGHQSGDACLKSIAQILAMQARRPADLAARYGGEEFVLLLPETDEAGCRQIGERIRKGLSDLAMSHDLNLPSKKVTVSIGAAIVSPGAVNFDNGSLLVEAADRALYAAKEFGRDRLVMSGQIVGLTPSKIA